MQNIPFCVKVMENSIIGIEILLSVDFTVGYGY